VIDFAGCFLATIARIFVVVHTLSTSAWTYAQVIHNQVIFVRAQLPGYMGAQ
jgi:hypothetical protein